jgi:glycosidase
LSKFSKKSAWTKNGKRGQYYYHTFFEEMPELNLRNPDVLKELEDIMAFWLNKGVDGFRMGYTSNLIEAESLTDEKSNGGSSKVGPGLSAIEILTC